MNHVLRGNDSREGLRINMEMDLISVIVPVFNVGEFLLPSLDSLAAQSYPNLEILLIDDGSTDGSGALCDEYAAKDARFHVIHKENGGVSSARNLGLDIAKGKYIAFIDSDDRILPDYFSVLYQNLQEQNVDVVCCNFAMLDEAGNLLREHSRGAWGVCPNVKNDRILTDWNLVLQDILGRRELYFTHAVAKLMRAELAASCRFQGLRYSEDTLYMFDVFCLQPKVQLIKYPGYQCVLRMSSVTRSAPKNNLRHAKDTLTLAFHEYRYLAEKESKLTPLFLETYGQAVHAYAYKSVLAENSAEYKMVCAELNAHLESILLQQKQLTLKTRSYILLYAKTPWLYRFLIRMRAKKQGNE